MLRSEELQLLIQVTHCQVHIPCTNTYVRRKIQSVLIDTYCTGFMPITKTMHADLRASRLNPPEQKHCSQHVTETSCETHCGF